MKGFFLFDKDYRPLDAQNRPCIDTSNKGLHPLSQEPAVPAYFGFDCPRGGYEIEGEGRVGGRCHYLRLRGGPADDGTRPTWTWDGDRENPTFEPSINCLSHNPSNPTEKYAGCGWHGWIRDGKTVGA